MQGQFGSRVVLSSSRPLADRFLLPAKQEISLMGLAQRLRELNIELPAVPGPFGAYVPAKRVGNLVYVAGQLPMKEGRLLASGQVPSRCTIDAAKAAAR